MSIGRMRSITLGGCVAAAIAFAVADPAAAQQLREVPIGLPSTAIASGSLRFAEQLGLFAKHGLRPKFTYLENANVTTSALIAGSVEFSISGSGEIIAAHAAGKNVITIGNLYAGFANYLVVSKAAAEKLGVSPNAPVSARIKATDDLMIGVVSSTSVATIGVKATLAAGGVNPRFTFVAQNAMLTALSGGTIQGFVAPTPTATNAVTNGTGYIWLSGPGGDFPLDFTPGTSSTLQTMREFANANPELIKKMTAILADFSKEVQDNPAGVKAVIAKLYPDLNSDVIDLFFKNEAHAWQAKPLTAKDMEHEIEFLKRAGTLPTERLSQLNPAAMVYP